MAFDLQEQEQIAELKAFWHDYGRHIAAGLLLAAVLLGAWKGWQFWQNNQVAKAAAIYAKVDEAAKDADKLKPIVAELKADYASTAYASRAALIAARAAFDKNDLAAAQTELKWVIENSSEAGLRDTARLRLAYVLIDDKKLDEALAQVKSAEEPSFSALYAEVRGDVLALKGDKAGAVEAYKQALAKMTKGAASFQFVEIKMEALGN